MAETVHLKTRCCSLELPLDTVFPAVLFIGSGASCFVLLKKLKDPVQQKTLIGAAILCMLPRFYACWPACHS